MKKTIITLSLSLLIIATLFAQKEKREKKEDNESKKEEQSKNCQISPKLKITSAVYDLFESYKKLLKPNGLCIGSLGTPTSFGTMDAAYYGNNGVTGKVTFSSFFTATNLFRTIWGMENGNFTAYGVCPPPAILFPNPPIAQNHIFGLKLVTVSNYATGAVNRDYNTANAVAYANIKAINCLQLEDGNGFIAASDNAIFSNVFSSKGILVLVSMVDGTQSWCYILNNYDAAGTIKWKE
jgi:hypothetical protein